MMRIILVLLLIVFAVGLHAAEVVNISVEADSYLRQGSPNQNQGADAIAVIQESGKNRALLRFNTQAIKQTSAATLISAKLRLYISQNANNWGTTGRDIGIYTLTQSWTEMGVTWNCRNDLNPSNSSTDCPGEEWTMYSGTHPELHPYNATPIAMRTITNNLTGNIEIDVTSYIQDILHDSINNYGLMVRKIIENDPGHLEVGTKESNLPAKLILTYESAPIPTPTPTVVPTQTPTPVPTPPAITDMPSATLHVSSMSGEVPLTTNFDFSNIKGSNTSITLYFDDGTSAIYTGTALSHLFSDQGIYKVVAVYQDDQGHSNQTEETIIVTGMSPALKMANSGIWITPNKMNPVTRQAGEKVVISGEICKVWKGAFLVTPICREMNDQNIQVTAYFPDQAHEVSHLVTITKVGNRRFFSFETPELKSSDLNQFSLTVGNIPPRVKQLLATKTRLELRVTALEAQLASLRLISGNEAKINRLTSSMNTLKTVITKITSQLSTRPEIIAEYRLPLQVEHAPSAQLYYASMFAGFKFEAGTLPGVKFEDESDTVKMKITNLANLPSNLPDDSDLVDFEGDTRLTADNDEHFYYAEFYDKGILVHTSVPKIMNANDAISYDHTVAHFASASSQDFTIELYRKKTANGTQARRWGRLEFNIPVVRDAVPPVWVAPISPLPEQHFLGEFPDLYAHVQDSSGVLNLASAKISINGTEQDAITETLPNGLVKVSGVKPLNPQDGPYSILYSIRDQSGNFATPNPLNRSFFFDKTPPAVSVNLAEGQIVRTPTFALMAQASDLSHFSLEFILNGTKIATSEEDTTNLNLNLNSGNNVLTILAVDALHNQSITSLNIFYDNAPPVIFLSHQNLHLTREGTYAMRVNVEDASLKKVDIFQNSTLVATQTGTQGQNFNLNLALFEGANAIRIVAYDMGDYSSEEWVFVTRDSVAPVLTLTSPSSPFITKENGMTIAGTFNEGLSLLTINNQNIAFDNINKKFEANIPLVNGTQAILIHAVDLAGNSGDLSLSGESVTINIADTLNLFQKQYLALAKSGGNTVISAPAGAVLVPNSKILITTNTGESRDVTVDNDGSFFVTIPAFLSATLSVTAPLIPPAFAQFTAQSMAPTAPLSVLFFADTSGQEIAELTWSFGEGTSVTTTFDNMRFDYLSAGDYFVSLTVKNAGGAQHTSTQMIRVGGGMIAAFSLPVTRGNAPFYLALDASSSFDLGQITSFRFESSNGIVVENPYPFALMVLETPGVHQITLKVKNAAMEEAVSSPIAVTVNAPPTLSVDGQILKAKAPGQVKVTATSSDSDSSGPVRFRYNFNDGTPIIETTATSLEHILSTAQTYNITVEAIDSDNAFASAHTSVTILDNIAPVALVTANVQTGHIPLHINLNASGSTDDEGIVNFGYAVGSGPEVLTTSSSFLTTINTVGNTTIFVRVLDRQGLEALASVNINALPPNQPPVANLVLSASSGIAPLELEADASGSSDDFGIADFTFIISDGRRIVSSTPKIPLTFLNPGIYAIAVIVKDSAGVEVTSAPISVTVLKPPRAYFIATPLIDTVPVVVSLISTQGGDGAPIVRTSWSCGNGQTFAALSFSASCSFNTVGEFVTSLEVEDSFGEINTYTRTIQVKENHAPNAYLTQSALSGRAPLLVTFNASASTDDSKIENYKLECTGPNSEISVVNQTTSLFLKTFTSAGEYICKLTVSDRQGLVSSKSASVSVLGPNTAPIASFTLNKSWANTTDKITVDASASSDDSKVSAYRLSLGNGSIVTGRTPIFEISYLTAGSFSLSMIVIDDEGLPSAPTVMTEIRINARPVALLSSSRLEGNPGEEFIFNAGGSSDSDGTITQYKLEVEGTTLTQSSPIFPYTFSTGGIKTITLTAVDNDGAKSFKSMHVNINSAPVALAQAYPISGEFPLLVSFDLSKSSDNEGIVRYEANYGDGQSATLTSPGQNHLYQNPGEFLAQFTAFDRMGLSHTVSVLITVLPNASPVASLEFTLSHGKAPSLLTLDAKSSHDSRGISNYRFIISKGEEELVNSPQTSPLYSQNLTSAGSYTAKVIVTDDQGATGIEEKTFTIGENTPPVASLALLNEMPVTAPFVSQLSAALSSDDEGIVSYQYFQGDGTSETLTTPTHSRIITVAGPYIPRVVVTDRQGETSEATLSYTAEERPPRVENNPPTITFSPEEGLLNANPGVVTAQLSDESDIDISRFVIKLGPTILSPSEYSYDVFSKKLEIDVLSYLESLSPMEEALVSVRAVDIHGNLSSRAALYVMDWNNPDVAGPIFNFIPGGGSLSTLTPTVQIAIFDKSGADYSGLSLSLNDIPVPTDNYTVDEAQNKITVNFDSSFSLSDQTFSVLKIEISDTLGNLARGKVGLDTMGHEVVTIERGGQEALGFEAGRWHSCAVMNTGGVRCWGRYSEGQLGYGTMNLNKPPAFYGDVPLFTSSELTSGVKVEQLVSISHNNCVLTSFGNVRCWGDNTFGELGLGHTSHIGDNEPASSAGYTSLLTAAELADGIKVKKISGNWSTICALFTNGGVRCWGSNSGYVRGDKSPSTANLGDNELPSSVPMISLGGPAVDITVTQSSACALLNMPTGEEMRCWGHGGWGALGLGYTISIGDDEYPSDMTVFTQVLSPTEKAQGRMISSMASSAYANCVHFEDKGVRCWGTNTNGGIGYPNKTVIGDNELPYTVGDVQILSPAELAAGRKVELLRMGIQDTTCAIINDGAIRCFGKNIYGNLGIGHTSNIGDDEYPYTAGDVPVFTAAEIAAGRKVVDVLIGFDHTCITSDLGMVKCFGGNYSWQLGLGAGAADFVGDYEFPSELSVFSQILSSSEKIGGRSIDQTTSGGDSHCTLFNDKGVRCWGNNVYGQIGYPGLLKVGNAELPLSVGDVQILSQAEISAGRSVEVLRQGRRHTCAILNDGGLRCFGYNGVASLGLGHLNNIGDDESPYTADDVSVFTPTEILEGRKVIDVAVGYDHTCIVNDLGQVKCWGDNHQYQLGYLGSGADTLGDNELPSSYGYVDMGGAVQLTPDGLDTPRTATAFGAGQFYTCAMLVDDSLRCWGINNNGQLGLGSLNPFPSQTKTPAALGNVPLFTASELSSGEKIKELISEFLNNCVLTNFSHVRCWGYNASGELGLGHTNKIGDNEPASAAGFVSLLSADEIAQGVLVDKIAGHNSTCAHLSNGNVRCFGPNSNYIMGNRTASTAHIGDNELPSSIPPVSLGGSAIEITVGGVSACARLNMSGGEEMRCWGNGAYGGLGLAATYGQSIGDNELPSSYSYVNLGGAVSIPIETTTLAAHFTATPEYGPVPLSVYFDATSASSTAGTIASFHYEIYNDFNLLDEFYGPSPTLLYVFLTPDTYIIRLTITDNVGNTATEDKIITVGDRTISPVAILNVTPNTGKLPLTATLDASLSYSALYGINNFNFHFGDGVELTTTSPVVSYTYTTFGPFRPYVVVTDNMGQSTTSLKHAVVADSLNYAPVAVLNCLMQEGRSVVCRTLGSYDVDGKISAILIDFGDGISISSPLTGEDFFHTFPEGGKGRYTIFARIADEFGLISEASSTVQYDFNQPQIAATISNSVLTNSNIGKLDVHVSDESQTLTRIYLNEMLIRSTYEKNFSIYLTYREGGNSIRIEATDLAGNQKIEDLAPVTLDQSPPFILSMTPNSGANLERLNVEILGTASENLQSASANGEALTVSEASFSKNISMPEGSNLPLLIVLTDLAGNRATFTRSVNVFRRNLIAELISINPSSTSLSKLIISGAPDAARPGILIKIKTSLFGSDEIIAGNDGSFEFETDYFNQVELSATDYFNRTDTVTKNYQALTTLSGVVKDALSGNPISGITVKILSSNQSAQTDSEGVFTISNPITGDHSIEIDGTALQIAGRSYSKSSCRSRSATCKKMLSHA